MEKVIQYKINKISQVEFWLNPKSDFVIPDSGCEVRLNLTLSLLRETQEVNLRVNVQYFEKKTGEELMRFATDFLFHVLDYDNVFSFQNNRVDIPDGFLIIANSIAVGTVRGMLIVLTQNSYLQNIYLPIYDPNELLASFKSQFGRAEVPQTS